VNQSKLVGVLLALSFLVFRSSFTFAVEQTQPPPKQLERMSDLEQARRIEELERLFSGLERKLDRLDDRIEKLDHDIKELRRKV
jgi:uncharacterized protein HemX